MQSGGYPPQGGQPEGGAIPPSYGPLQPGYDAPIPNPSGGPPSYGGSPGYSGPGTPPNTSGQGQNAIVPAEVAQGFNWGAFGLNWIWGISNKVNIAFVSLGLELGWFFLWKSLRVVSSLCFFAGIGFAVYLGIKGNELAWKNRQFESVLQFKKFQKAWSIGGIGCFVVTIIILILFVLALDSFNRGMADGFSHGVLPDDFKLM